MWKTETSRTSHCAQLFRMALPSQQCQWRNQASWAIRLMIMPQWRVEALDFFIKADKEVWVFLPLLTNVFTICTICTMSDNFYNFTILTLWLFVLEIVTIFELLGSIFNSCNVFILISYTNRHATWASSLPHPSSHTGILSKYTLPWNKFKSCGIIWEFFSKLPTPKTMKNNENGWWKKKQKN